LNFWTCHKRQSHIYDVSGLSIYNEKLEIPAG
jgi:hypothetical protein